ncbi:MAG: co-chaperone DjlA [Gammaproteobacteria bacterium]
MAWWGKLIGGTLGFLVGGPLGALLGASFGHNFDAGGSARGGFRPLPGDQERIQTAFFTATFSVMGYVAKADGRVTREEIDLANALMNEMQLVPEQRKLAQELFNQGKQDGFDFDAVVSQFKMECHRRTTLIRMFLEIQVQAAFADQRLDPKENKVLQVLAQSLGFSQAQLDQIIDMVQGSAHTHEHPDRMDLVDAYAILGVKANTPLAEIKKAYRRLLSQHHPDKLVSRGLPEEMIRLANEKTHEIQQAWNKIKESRPAH